MAADARGTPAGSGRGIAPPLSAVEQPEPLRPAGAAPDRLGVEPDVVVQDVTEIVQIVGATRPVSDAKPAESLSGD